MSIGRTLEFFGIDLNGFNFMDWIPMDIFHEQDFSTSILQLDI